MSYEGPGLYHDWDGRVYFALGIGRIDETGEVYVISRPLDEMDVAADLLLHALDGFDLERVERSDGPCEHCEREREERIAAVDDDIRNRALGLAG